MSIKQDRTGTRTSEDLRRRINVKSIDEASNKVDASVETVNLLNNEIVGLKNSLNNTRKTYVSTDNQTFTEEQKIRARNNIGAGTSSFSGSYDDIEDKPTSIYNINTEEYDKINSVEIGAQVNTIETIKVNGVVQPIANKTVDINVSGDSTEYIMSNYAESGVEILRSKCVSKNNRVSFNFVGTKSMSANTTTTLFTLPSDLRPTETRDFICFGQTSNTDGYIGYGYITSDGLLQVRFNTAITSYIRFSFVYDIY